MLVRDIVAGRLCHALWFQPPEREVAKTPLVPPVNVRIIPCMSLEKSTHVGAPVMVWAVPQHITLDAHAEAPVTSAHIPPSPRALSVVARTPVPRFKSDVLLPPPVCASQHRTLPDTRRAQ